MGQDDNRRAGETAPVDTKGETYAVTSLFIRSPVCCMHGDWAVECHRGLPLGGAPGRGGGAGARGAGVFPKWGPAAGCSKPSPGASRGKERLRYFGGRQPAGRAEADSPNPQLGARAFIGGGTVV